MVFVVAGHGIVPLPVPVEATGSCILQTLVNCSNAEDCGLQSSSELRLVGSVRDVVIRPARKLYRPGDTGKLYSGPPISIGYFAFKGGIQAKGI